MKMYLISENINTYTGMRLAGVEGVVVHGKTDVKKELLKAVQNKEYAIILITEKIAEEFPEIVSDVRLNYKQPLLVEIPDRYGTGRKEDFITNYVNEAIGIKL
ncbi:V-type ATP synthase subunit F [Lacticigenium naphthae]|uniref:V-type ATP synthase subunit F n=1 Tax=Lacticigenium naphthae TaxID=515351 RepID=UPI0004067EC3|nr:V-type ATP synthase subunit F [Lacticigenium naphthae]